MKKTLLSVVASAIIAPLSAENIVEIKQGWNLVGITSKSDTGEYKISDYAKKHPNITSITTSFDGENWVSYDPTAPDFLQGFTTLDPAKGYWFKSTGDFNLTLGDEEITLDDVSLQAGWNLVAINPNEISSMSSDMDKRGYKLSSITSSFDGENWVSYDPTAPAFLQGFTDIESGQGYWVKVQKALDTVETTDGYEVQLFADSEGKDFSSTIEAIKQKTIAEVGDMNSSDLENVSNLVVSFSRDGITAKSPYLDPRSDFKATLETVVQDDLDIDKKKDAFTTAGTSLYVYEISEAGSPKIINNVSVYEAIPTADGNFEKGGLLGETSPTGFLYVPEVSTDETAPTVVILEKDGFEESVQSLKAVEGTANYLYISEDSDEDIEEGIADENGLGRSTELYDTLIGVWNKPKSRTSGMLFTPTGISNNFNFKFKSNSKVSKLDDQAGVQKIVAEKGKVTNVLGALTTYIKDKGRKRYGLSFNNLFDGLSDPADVNLVLGLSLSEDLINLLDEDKDAFKKKVRLFTYETGKWEEILNPDFEIYTENDAFNDGHHADQERNLKKFFSKDKIGKNAALIVGGNDYDTLSPIFAIHQEEVNTTVDTNFVTYNLDVNVSSLDGNPLRKASVTLTRGNGNTEIIKAVSPTGDSIASFKILTTRTSLEDFKITVFEGDHYPISKNYSVTDLTPILEGETNSSTTLNLSMKAPPEYAVVKGVVANHSTGHGVRDSEVELLYPLSMAEIDSSVRKVINNKEEEGVQVSLVPNARYKWYIKEKSAGVEDVTKVNTDLSQYAFDRTLSRVSEERWTLVQDSTASDGGNFLPYNIVIAQALTAKKSTDASDINVIAHGKFEIALQVEHDIDGDGQADFTELAKSDTALANTDGENFSSDINEDYGSEIGFISTIVDVDKMVEDGLIQAGGIDTTDFYSRDGSTFTDISEIAIEEEDAIGSYLAGDEDADYEDIFQTGGSYIEGQDYDEQLDDLADNFDISLDKFFGSHKRKYLQVDNLLGGYHSVNNYEWRVIIAPTTIGDVMLRLEKDSSGNYNWVKTETQDFSFDEHFDFSTPLKTSRSRRLHEIEIARFISSDKVINKLSENIEKVFIDLGIDTSSLSDEEKATSMFNHGFNFRIFAKVHAEPTVDSINQDDPIFLGTATSLSFGQNKELRLRDYLKVNVKNFQSPTLLSPSQTATTDRVGLYEFAVVPLQYGNMDNSLSLLRVEASKLGYYSSPVTNVDMYAKDDVQTAIREDVRRIDLQIEEKNTYSVTVNVTDKSTQQSLEALVEIDGVKTEQNLEETESTKVNTGSSVTFDNILGSNERIIRVSVPDSNYMPVIKTVPLSGNSNINISLTSSDDVPDSTARISIKDSSVDLERGTISVTLDAFDKAEGNLTKDAELHVYSNGLKVKNPNVSHEKGSNEFKINLDLEIGSNEIGFEIANLKGFSSRYTVKAEYDPTIGSINGEVLNSSGDGKVVVDFYTKENQYFDTVVLPENNQFFFDELKAGESYKLQAVQFDTAGEVIKVSPFATVTVPAGLTFTQDLQLADVEASAGFAGGAPVFDFIGNEDGSTFTVETATGMATFSATVSNFDKENEIASVWFFVNDQAVEVEKSALQSTNTDFSYTIQDYSVKLDAGTNVVYGAAINPDSTFDWTVDKYVDWNPEATSLHSIVGQINGKGEALSYSYASLYNYTDGSFLGTEEANENGEFEFDNLLSGTYEIYVEGGNEFENFGQAYTISDTDLNVEINLTEFNNTIAIPDFTVNISGDDTVVADHTITVTANINSIDTLDLSAFTLAWKVDGQSVSETTQTLSKTAPNDGTSSMDFEVTITHSSGESATDNKVVYVTPQELVSNNNLPEIHGIIVSNSDDANDTDTDFTFEVNATDIDGESLSYSWFIDGVDQNNNDIEFVTNFSTTGDVNVSVEATDGFDTVEDSLIINIQGSSGSLARPPVVPSL
jgi:hypothetical protein